MSLLLKWGFHVALSAVMITLCESLLPDGNSKRFAQIGLNLLLLCEILRPLMELIEKQ